ncbi:hypothetical protein EMPS_00621 [Entomortierella parvispora]|uniref:Chromatin target of PRMT1 protein C-terminal domain-containing protein n=1 Tax=Entomortierella parvispora TaxID=205924 RepID=A0A9P3LS56_9FUNG|nr:hypothetical protein EMPS_00621 [Entomortierella parvispora]
MAAQHGQILYLSGSKGPQGSPSGSLSNRFQKLSQSRGNGITVVNQPAASDRASSSVGRGSHGITRGGGLVRGGLHTPGGLARAMQERGGGVSDEFLLSPSIGTTGGPSRRKKGVLIGTPASTPMSTRSHNGHSSGINTRASRHKSMVIGSRPGRAAAAATQVSHEQSKAQQQQQSQRGGKVAGRGGRGGRGGLASTSAAQGKQPVANAGKKAKAKGKGKPVQKADAQSLDSELSSYMMANSSTAASLLDQDLDTYMADMPTDGTF